jgi:acetamidase/formamidase
MQNCIFRRAIICAGFCLVASLTLSAETHTIYAKQYHHVFSAHKEPLLRVKPGDTVITRTIDAGGKDFSSTVVSDIGNPLTGPFYLDGAEPGDSISVHLDSLRLNRNWGHSEYRLMPGVISPAAVEKLYKNEYKKDAVAPGRSNLIPWDLDLKRQVANPRLLTGSGFKFDLPVKPMLGCIGVATPGETVLTSGPASSHGGNMDYNDVVEGATLYFPVYHEGAYLYLGDGHALQGDGEGLGSGIETSLDVQFTVNLYKGKPLSNPRLVSEAYLISIAPQPEFSSSMDQGIRIANTDMIRWLTSEYKLTEPEVHLLMGTVVQHKIVTYFGTMATMMPRKYLPKQ